MIRGGTQLVTVEQPAPYYRDKVIYPEGINIDPENGTMQWLSQKGNEYNTLKAGFGRYVMIQSCGYLRTDENGWEHCGAYDERPQTCQDFEVGGKTCQLFRILRGADLLSDQ